MTEQLRFDLRAEKQKLLKLEAEPARKAKATKPVTPAKLKKIPHVTAERKQELAKIFEDPNIPWDKGRNGAAQEASAEYMAELEEAREYFPVAAYVFRERSKDECIRTVVFSLQENTFFMDWIPYTDDADGKKTKEFLANQAAERAKYIEDVRFTMGVFLLRHKYQPLGLYCISGPDEEDPLNDYVVWRFTCEPPTPEDQDFLQTVAHAMRFAPYARQSSLWCDWCTEIDFWKRADGTVGFHFYEQY